MAGGKLNPVRSVDEARKLGRKGGIASGKARAEKKNFKAMLDALLDSPMDELEKLSPRLAICKAMILKAAEGDKQAADWVRDTVGEKPVDKAENTNTDTVKVILFGGE